MDTCLLLVEQFEKKLKENGGTAASGKKNVKRLSGRKSAGAAASKRTKKRPNSTESGLNDEENALNTSSSTSDTMSTVKLELQISTTLETTADMEISKENESVRTTTTTTAAAPINEAKPEPIENLINEKSQPATEAEPQPEPAMTKKLDEDKNSSLINFEEIEQTKIDDRLEAEYIIGAVPNELERKLYFLIKWKNPLDTSNQVQFVPAKYANERFPQVVIKFYESRVEFENL